MKEKPIKLIMELLFIFIIPLIIICINCNYENTIEYDNNGNYQATEKHIEFTTPFTYTKTETKTEEEINYYLFQKGDNINTIYFLEDDFLSFTSYLYAVYDEEPYNNSCEISLFADSGELYYLNDYINIETILTQVNTITINNVTYKGFNINLNLNINSIEIDQNAGYYLLETTETIETTNTIWGNIKELIIDALQIQDTIIIDIIITYTILFTIMFLIWHVWYGLFELIFHIIPKGRLRC